MITDNFDKIYILVVHYFQSDCNDGYKRGIAKF